MKSFAFCALSMALLAGTGCKKEENRPREAAAPKPTTQETTAQPVETTPRIADAAKAATQEVVEETKAAVGNLQVKAEDVMAEMNQSVDALKQKVASMDTARLQAHADQYKEMILDKKDQIAAETAKLKELPVAEMMGEKGRAIKERISQYGHEISGLKERCDVYLGKLKELGTGSDAANAGQ